jgi:hypothetical protein
MFARNQLTHVPVVEMGEGREQRLRGMLSAARVKRLLSRSESLGQWTWDNSTQGSYKVRAMARPTITADRPPIAIGRIFR